jgi:hypothetical protein
MFSEISARYTELRIQGKPKYKKRYPILMLKSFRYLFRRILSKGKKARLAITIIKVSVFTFITSLLLFIADHFSTIMLIY